MKFNKWTLGLAAVGVVSLASAARADEAKMSQVQTALSNTTISGYVSASFNWAMSPGGVVIKTRRRAFHITYGQPAMAASKQDGFNLDVVKLSIAKPQDESPWAAGYQVDLLFGPDAVGYNPSVNSGRSAAVILPSSRRMWRCGRRWATGLTGRWVCLTRLIGYEFFDAGNDPNYTRSWGYAIEPTELTGVLASYKFCDEFSLSAGIANTLMAGINARAYNY